MWLRPLQRSLELPDPLLHGDIERGERARRHRSRRQRGHGALEAFHASTTVSSCGPVGLVVGKVAAHQQPLAQEIVVRSLRAEREFCLGRDRRPAAAHRDVGIAQRSLPDPLCGALVKGRLMRQRQRGGRTRLRRRSGRGLLRRRRVRGDPAGLAGCCAAPVAAGWIVGKRRRRCKHRGNGNDRHFSHDGSPGSSQNAGMVGIVGGQGLRSDQAGGFSCCTAANSPWQSDFRPLCYVVRLAIVVRNRTIKSKRGNTMPFTRREAIAGGGLSWLAAFPARAQAYPAAPSR